MSESLKKGDIVEVVFKGVVKYCQTGLNSGAKYQIRINGEDYWISAKRIRKVENDKS